MAPSPRHWTIALAPAAAALAAATLGSCVLPRMPGHGPLPIRAIEEIYQEARALRDQIDVTRSRDSITTRAGVALADLVLRYNAARAKLESALAAGASAPLSEDDHRALEVMRRTLALELVEEKVARAAAGTEGEVDCTYDPELVANRKDGYEALSKRIYACFSKAAHSLSFDGQPIDRLTIFGLLTLTDDPSRREELWRAFAPIWEAVNGDNGPRSPYRTLVRKNSARLRDEGKKLGESVRSIGVEPAVMEE